MSILCNVRGIISRFKEISGKDYSEWKKILLSKPHYDRRAAYDFMVEQGMKTYIGFLLWTCAYDIKYISKTSRPIPGEEAHFEFLAKVANDAKSQNVLYEKETLYSTFKIEIFYENGNLIVSKWILNDRYEDERSIVIDKKDLSRLLEFLGSGGQNLTAALKARFCNDTAFEDIQQLLRHANIDYSGRLY
ncbi:MAG TPA: hypothetical protein PLB59_01210 [Bacteroidales bacterium]|nr:hypothetical protein [Bacteroidales bacterium]HQP14561.1 hypothetical protein [Bacteroidales bacterium]